MQQATALIVRAWTCQPLTGSWYFGSSSITSCFVVAALETFTLPCTDCLHVGNLVKQSAIITKDSPVRVPSCSVNQSQSSEAMTLPGHDNYWMS